jgi:hypothetical protein
VGIENGRIHNENATCNLDCSASQDLVKTRASGIASGIGSGIASGTAANLLAGFAQNGHTQAWLVVDSGYWPLFRRDPNASPKFVMDSKGIKKGALEKFLKNEVRYESLRRIDEKRLVELQGRLQEDIDRRWDSLVKLTRDYI